MAQHSCRLDAVILRVLTLDQLTCGGEEVARFVPSRSTEPAATRAHLVFFGAPAGLEAAAVRDQALLTLIAIKQLVNLAPKGVNASEMLAHGVAGALK
jgi:hypothetical protein